MSEEKASPCVLHIHGENIQVLPNAMFAIQYICLDPGEKPEVVSEKDVRPDPEPCDLLASYIQDEEVRHDFVKRIAQCPDVATLCQTVLTDLLMKKIIVHFKKEEFERVKNAISIDRKSVV